ncbi:hypothetical protein Pan216_33560 [Planctomycetes bacterium Pan216]|uniref:DUF6268 domain-containing protein n=1 Tax=Kolteria novifilia TaxID=2527975 RepID=A0A518B689_9BACT|nr:hypothetical protein Pan216_33560 [Planctomycetes bacterium Pan216]
MRSLLLPPPRRSRVAGFVALLLVAIGVRSAIAEGVDKDSSDRAMGNPDAVSAYKTADRAAPVMDGAGDGLRNATLQNPEEFGPLDETPPMTVAPGGRRKFRPSATFDVEGEPTVNGFSYGTMRTSTRLPLPIKVPGKGPPIMLSPKFSVATFDAPTGVDLPSDVYDISLGISLMRPIGQRWMLMLAVQPNLVTDFHNTSGDAWRVGGMAIGTLNHSEQWKFSVGAIITGREDIPALPAVGAIWTPSPRFRADLIFPRPRLSYRILENGERAQWLFLSGGLGGGTWAFRESDGDNNVFSYRELRFTAGWESAPGGQNPSPFASGGLRYFFEAGYVFDRRIEYDHTLPDFNADGGAVLSAGLRF